MSVVNTGVYGHSPTALISGNGKRYHHKRMAKDATAKRTHLSVAGNATLNITATPFGVEWSLLAAQRLGGRWDVLHHDYLEPNVRLTNGCLRAIECSMPNDR